MNRIISIFAVMSLLMISCISEFDNGGSVIDDSHSEEGIFAPGKYTFDVDVVKTKAMKTSWESGDRIFVFFDDDATKAATGVSNLPYITLDYNGEEWVVDDNLVPAEIPESGILSAVYCPFGGGAITTESGKFYVSKSMGFYLSDEGVAYTNVDNNVSFVLTMQLEQPYAEFFLPYSEALDREKKYTLSVRNSVKNADNSLSKSDIRCDLLFCYFYHFLFLFILLKNFLQV